MSNNRQITVIKVAPNTTEDNLVTALSLSSNEESIFDEEHSQGTKFILG